MYIIVLPKYAITFVTPMRLAILVTNTDLSEFAHRHPFDGEKFTTMIQSVRPDWTCDVYLAHQNQFPDDITAYDGVMITGSPSSVHDADAWVGRLLEKIRSAASAKTPIYGACYGHQAVALALGGTIGPNPHGWTFGLEACEIVAPQPWMEPLGHTHHQFAAHIEQVVSLPPEAHIITRAKGVPCAGFVIGRHIYTSQNHPEMERGFFTALLDEYRDKLGAEVADKADASLRAEDDNALYTETIARFFEQAVS